jgi:signal transduction histidine kinase
MTKRFYLIIFLALPLASSAQATARKTQSDGQIVRAYLAMIPVDVRTDAKTDMRTQQSEKAEECKNILLNIADTSRNSNLLKDVYYALGRYYLQRLYVTTAQDYFLKSLALFEKDLDTTANPIAEFDYALECNMLSRVYLDLEMPEKSIAALHRAVRFASVSPYVDNRLCGTFVEAYATLGQIDSALYYESRLLQNTGTDAGTDTGTATGATIRADTGVVAEIVSTELHVAAYYLNTSDDEKAILYLRKADTLAAQTGSALLIYRTRTMMARYLEETGDAIRAIDLLEQTLPFARQVNRELYVQALDYMALAQKKKGNSTGSLAYYQEYVRQQDSLAKEKSSLTFADLQTHYLADQKKHRLAVPDSPEQSPAQDSVTPSPTTLMMALAVALVIIAIMGYVIYRNKEKTDRLLNFQSERIRTMESRLATAIDTKARLLGRIGHGLRSPVSRLVQLLQLQKDDSPPSDQESLHNHEDKLRMASERVVESMEELLLWSNSQMEHFTPQFAPVRLKPVIQQELDTLQPLISGRGLRIGNDVADDFSRITDKSIVTVIIRHLLQNAMDSGADGHAIYIRASGTNLHISYPAGLRNAKPSGSSLMIAEDLATAIRAEIIFSRPNDGYLTAALSWKS